MSRNELLRAIADDDVARAAELVYQNVNDACQTDPDSGRNALHEAAVQGRCAILRELMRYVTAHPGRDRNRDTVLTLALRGGHFDCVELVLARTPQLWPDDRDCIAALIAGGHDRGDIAAMLFQRGARLRHVNGALPLLGDAQLRHLPEVAATIRQRAADHDALVAACRANDAASIDVLLNAQRANPNEVDADGWPPLARAIEARAPVAIDRLVERGASIDAWVPAPVGTSFLGSAVQRLDRCSLTALAMDRGAAIARHWVRRCNLLWDGHVPAALRECIGEHSELDASISDTTLAALDNGSRDRLLQAAAWSGDQPLIERLRQRGGRADSLAPAALWADLGLLDALLAAGGSANACGRDGLPALHLLALSDNDVQMLATRLVELGAELGCVHRELGTALEFAERLGRPVLVEHLRTLGDVGKFRWQRDARARGIARIRFIYHKADGVTFVPTNPDQPLEVGGDYDGAYPMDAAKGLWEVQGRGLFDQLGPRQRAILEKLARGEDFGLDEVLATVTPAQIEYRRR